MFKTFKKLIKRYENITREEIARKVDNYSDEKGNLEWYILKRDLTGFGDAADCILCKEVKKQCGHCAWMKLTESKCFEKENGKTFNQIDDAETIESLYQAYKDRAKYMRKVLEKYANNQLPKIGKCPSCGSKLVILEEYISANYSTINEERNWEYQVHCQKCKARGPVKEGKENAINAWNALLRKGIGQDGTGNTALVG
ncbi:MAG: hypothetical protein K9K32_00255, partial [Halanaerobiales bacterium]|nr:hypothetical protein [Halanaerobiales bacterium]